MSEDYQKKLARWRRYRESHRKTLRAKDRKFYKKNKGKKKLPEPIKDAARHFLRLQIKKGKILVPKNCYDCGKLGGMIKMSDGRQQRELVADHYKGYEQKYWLVVQFICRLCDGKRRSSS